MKPLIVFDNTPHQVKGALLQMFLHSLPNTHTYQVTRLPTDDGDMVTPIKL